MLKIAKNIKLNCAILLRISGQKGAMALSSILALSMILLALGLAMTYSGFIQTDMAYNQDKAAIAFYVAEAGAKDAMQKIVRNTSYENTAGYDLLLVEGSAHVVVNIGVPAVERTEILSTGVVGSNTKKIRVILNTDADNNDNGRVTIVSWDEVGS